MRIVRAVSSLPLRQLLYNLLSLADIRVFTDDDMQGITAAGSSMAYSVTKSAGILYIIPGEKCVSLICNRASPLAMLKSIPGTKGPDKCHTSWLAADRMGNEFIEPGKNRMI